jgi:hypothetical protein
MPETTDLTDIRAEQDDDGEVTVYWRRGTDQIALVCRPSGKLFRTVSPYRAEEPPITTHVMEIAGV